MSKARCILAAGLLGAWGLGAQRLVPPGITTLPTGGGKRRRDAVAWRPRGAASCRGISVSGRQRPLAIALADLNGGGKADIVTGDGARNDISAILSP